MVNTRTNADAVQRGMNGPVIFANQKLETKKQSKKIKEKMQKF